MERPTGAGWTPGDETADAAREWPASRATEPGCLASDIVQMALSEASRIRLEALRSGERMYEELLRAARARADETVAEGRREADRIVAEARHEAAAIRARRIQEAGPPADEIEALRSEMAAITRLLREITGESAGAPVEPTLSPDIAVPPLAFVEKSDSIPVDTPRHAGNGRDSSPEGANGDCPRGWYPGNGEESPSKDRRWAPPDWMSLE